jgi:hypothetical protein
MADEHKKCVYEQNYKRCPQIQRHFICCTALYRHCGTYINLARVDRDRERGFKTVENLVEDKR